MQVKIRRSKTDKDPMIFDYDFGENVTDAIEMFDGESPLEKVVHGLFIVAAKQQLAEYVRQCLEPKPGGKGKKPKPGMSLEEIQESIKTWKPSVEKRASANVNRTAKQFAKLSPEEREALKKLLAEQEGDDSAD